MLVNFSDIMLKIVGCFSIIMVFILSFGLIDVSAQTIDVSATASIKINPGSGQKIWDITTFQIGTDTYALVGILTSYTDPILNKVFPASGALQIFNITNPAMPTHTSTITNGTNGFDRLSAPKITTVQIGSDIYALVASQQDHGVQIINITDPENPMAVTSITDGDTDDDGGTFDTLDRPRDITTVKIGSVTYALVADSADNGVQIIDVSDPTTPTAVTSITDGDTDSDGGTFDKLRGAIDITTVQIGSATYALVVSNRNEDVQIINITNPAAPIATSSVTGDGTSVLYDVIRGISTVKIGDETYAIVLSRLHNSVQIINITNPATPTAVSSITDGDSDGDGGTFKFSNLRSIATTDTIGSDTYALVTSLDNGVQIVNITNPAMPTAVTSITNGDDDGNGNIFDALDSAVYITTVKINDSTYALATSNRDDSIQIIGLSHSETTVSPSPQQGTAEATSSSQESVVVTLDIRQPDLPTVTFSNSTVDVAIDGEGNGLLAFQSLIDDGIVTITNQGANNIRFEFDRTNATFNSINPDDDGLPATASFTIPTFTESHTIVYNRTHLAFNFNDPTYRGTTPSLPLQVSLHGLSLDVYRNNPPVHAAVGNTSFTIIDPPLCETKIGAVELNLGTFGIGEETPVNGATIEIKNSGNASNDITIGADYWCDALDNDCTAVNDVMLPSTTSFASGPDVVYAAKTQFTDNFVAGTTPIPNDVTLFLLTASNSTAMAYLQVSIDLLPEQGRFTGSVSQEILIGTTCN